MSSEETPTSKSKEDSKSESNTASTTTTTTTTTTNSTNNNIPSTSVTTATTITTNTSTTDTNSETTSTKNPDNEDTEMVDADSESKTDSKDSEKKSSESKSEESNSTTGDAAEADVDGDVETEGEPETESATNETEIDTRPKKSLPKRVVKARETRTQIEERARAFLAKQTYRVIIPSFAAWFDRSKFHDIEKRSLPEFFNNKHRTKTPEIYMDYRNFMIDTYRLNPVEYLTFTACRRNLAGDVAAIMRVFSFLEQWGLINYQIDPETRPSTIGPQFTGHFQILLDSPQGLIPFLPAKNSKYTNQGKESSSESILVEDPTTTTAAIDSIAADANSSSQISQHQSLSSVKQNGTIKKAEKQPSSSLLPSSSHISSVKIKQEPEESNLKNGTNLNLRRNLYDSTADAIALQDETQRQLSSLNTRTYNCYTCGDDTTNIRYHNLRSKQSLSPACFKNGFFPSNFSSTDFIKIVKAQSSNTEWSDQEVLLLMEGVEMFEDDWNAIAYHVGTRNRESCIVKFLQLPIEDPYLVQSYKNLKSKLEGSNNNNGVVKSDPSVGDASVGATETSPSILYQALKEFLKESKTAESLEETKELNKLIIDRAKKAIEGETVQQETNLGLLVNTELEKLHKKIAKFEQLEKVLAVEKQELQQAQQQLLFDRLALKRQSELVLTKLQAAVSASTPQEAADLAASASKIASQPLKRLTPASASDVDGTSSSGGSSADGGNSNNNNGTVKSSLKPISLDAPQTFSLWTA